MATQQQQQQEQVIQTLARLHDDPVLFVEQIIGAQPWDWQIQFLKNVARHDRVAVRSGHGVGKTTAIAWLILWFLLTRHPVKIGITGPSGSSIDHTVWAELQAWHRKMSPAFKELIRITTDKACLVGAESENVAIPRTSSRDKPEALAGLHSENMVFLIDEASGVDDLVFETASGSLSTPGAKVVLTGNPTRSSGYFFDAFHNDAKSWKLMRVNCLDNLAPNGPVGPGYPEEQERKYGRDSNTYKIRVLGQFPEGDDDAVIPRSLIESAIERDIVPEAHAPVVWGIDIARMGDDRSALCKRRGRELLEPVRSWGKSDLMQTCGLIMDEYNSTPIHLRPIEILIDMIGMGSGVHDRLQELGLPVRGINVADSPAQRDQYVRLRDELWHRGREYFESYDCTLPDQPELISELSQIRFSHQSDGRIKVESKADAKKRGIRSPDLADAFLLTLMNQSSGKVHAFHNRSLNVNTQYVV